MKLAAVLFDMDGVLIDSEPFWRQAEMEVFASVGLYLSEDDCRQTTGLRIDEVVALRHGEHGWAAPSCQEVAEAIVARVIQLVKSQGTPLTGVGAALEAARASGLPMAIASSSSYALIDATLEALNLGDYFPVRHSAQDEPLGKPHPGVYLRAAEKLGVAACRCLAVEDSLNGLVAAKSARMRAVVVPDRCQPRDPRFCLADAQLETLLEFPALLQGWLSDGEGTLGS